MYICIRGNREWSDELAEENEYFYTRKCGGELAPKAAPAPLSGDIIKKARGRLRQNPAH